MCENISLIRTVENKQKLDFWIKTLNVTDFYRNNGSFCKKYLFDIKKDGTKSESTPFYNPPHFW